MLQSFRKLSNCIKDYFQQLILSNLSINIKQILIKIIIKISKYCYLIFLFVSILLIYFPLPQFYVAIFPSKRISLTLLKHPSKTRWWAPIVHPFLVNPSLWVDVLLRLVGENNTSLLRVIRTTSLHLGADVIFTVWITVKEIGLTKSLSMLLDTSR